MGDSREVLEAAVKMRCHRRPCTGPAQMQSASAVVTIAAPCHRPYSQVAIGVFMVDRALHVPNLSNLNPLTSGRSVDLLDPFHR